MSTTAPRISVRGALTGACVCAIGRSAVVLLNFGDLNTLALLVALASGTIGMLVGAISGALAHPVKSGVTGAILSGIVFELFMLPCAHVFGTFGDVVGSPGAGREFLHSTIRYFLEMAAAGGIAGALSGYVGMRQTTAPQHSNIENTDHASS